MLRKINNLCEFEYLAKNNNSYAQIAIVASNNLGGPYNPTVDQALKWLEISALETEEEGILEEINFWVSYHKKEKI
jgi:hypothetical protein